MARIKKLNIQPDSIFFVEERFIAYLLTNPAMIADITVGINTDDFFSIQGKTIYAGVQVMELSGAEINAHSMVTYLNKEHDSKGLTKLDSIGGIDSLVAIVSQPAVSLEEAIMLKDAILENSRKRKIASVIQWAEENVNMDATQLMNQVEQKLSKIDNGGIPTSVRIGSDTTDLEARYEIYAQDEFHVIGLETGYTQLDMILDGLKDGETSCLYAPSSRYKSMFSSNMGWRLARNNIPGLWIPTEMTMPQLQERLVQFESGLNFRYLRADKDFARLMPDIEYATSQIKEMPIYISKSQDRDVGSIVRQIRKEKKWHDIKYVIIDMLDHIYSHTFQENEISNQSKVVRDITLAAKDVGVHVILVSHIAKEERTIRGRHVIPMEDIKGSSSKYQDIETAISIMPVKRQTDPDTGKRYWVGLSVSDISYRQQKRSLIPLYVSVQKNRNGTLGDVVFEVDPILGNRILERPEE